MDRKHLWEVPLPPPNDPGETHRVAPVTRRRYITVAVAFTLLAAPWWIGCWQIVRWLV